MKKWITLAPVAAAALHVSVTALMGFQSTQPASSAAPATQPTLRELYQAPPEQWPAATWDEQVAPEQRHELGLVPEVVAPESNPYSQEKADLGRQLFFDPRLSSSRNVACVSCHHPDTGWADGKTVSQGHQLQPLDRNTPTILGAALQPRLMWDGRAGSLESQALLPIANEKEMHGDFAEVTRTLNAIPEYRKAFKEVFGEEQITLQLVGKAIATFERTIMPGRSRFDSFLRGKHNALSDQQILGLHLFRTKARCINCHSGPLLSDGLLHNVGLTYYGRTFEDLGQYHITQKAEDVGKFRTPTLRNITRTGPYMHNGLFELDGVINIYNVGMPTERVDPNDPLAPKKSPLLKELGLTVPEKAALLAFLGALEEPRLRVRTPRLPGMYGNPSTQPAEEAAEAE
jgi:cytochrome c peroxidase